MSFAHLQLPLRKLQSTAFDGSVGYPRFRENQLAKLYSQSPALLVPASARTQP